MFSDWLGEVAVRLLAFPIEFVAILHAKLVRKTGGEHAVELHQAVVQLHVVGAEGIHGVVVRGLRLHAAGRIPAQPVVQPAQVLCLRNLPVDLRRIQHFVAGARNRAQIIEQSHCLETCDG